MVLLILPPARFSVGATGATTRTRECSRRTCSTARRTRATLSGFVACFAHNDASSNHRYRALKYCRMWLAAVLEILGHWLLEFAR